MSFDVAHARSHFPALESPWALLDNAGGSVTARGVIERVTEYMSRHQVQIGASYGLSQSAEAAVREGEAAAALLLGATAEETVVGASTTTNLRIIADAIGPLFDEGDEIIVTNLDHESNIGCWRRMAERHGLIVREWKLRPETASLDRDDLHALLGPRTRFVTFTQCANIVGATIDVPAMVDAIRSNRKDTIIAVDGVAYAPHRHIDVGALDVDLYAASLYKVYGPHLGVVFGRRELLLAAHGQNHEFIPQTYIPYKLQPGNLNHELTAGLPGVVEYLDAIAAHHDIQANEARARHRAVFDLFAEHEATLSARLIEGLLSIDGVDVLGPHDPDSAVRVPTITFTIDGMHASEVPPKLDAKHVGIRFGHFYAKRAVEVLGLAERGGVVRVSMVHYNTLDEVDRVLEGIRACRP